MTQPWWSADLEIDVSLAARLVTAAFSELGAQGVEPFGVGWDNAAFLIDGTHVFRFPRRRICAKRIDADGTTAYASCEMRIALSSSALSRISDTIREHKPKQLGRGGTGSASNVRSMPNESPETPEMRVVKTLIAGLREAERDRLLLWLAARYDVRGRERKGATPPS